MDSKIIREKYIKFFIEKNHKEIPSAPLIPENDPTTLFITAGMQPLIPYLLGGTYPEGKRLVDVQKCLRTDDIDEVGDEVHHTFFEMLGNWSLGDYFKKEAISWSYEFLTSSKWLNIPKEKLAISVFAGDSDAPFDSESYDTWLKLGIASGRIVKLPKKNNWWGPAGKTGPCGPDTEMFYWASAGNPPDSFDPDDSSWVEIWNNVFMQFFKKEDGSFEKLKQQNVDTGMGLERTVSVLGGLNDDYQTDLFLPIIERLEEQTSKSYQDNKVSFRIIVDHIKAATFLIKDGAMPSNKLQGYILRRLLRRAAVKLHQIGGSPEVLPELVDPVIGIYGETDYFQTDDRDGIRVVVEEEMKRFKQTLKKGLKEIEKIEKIDGKIAFDLYQTFGFPYEVTEELLRQKGQDISREQFKAEFEKHRELSRAASSGMFKGGLADHSDIVIKYHTATHLLHQALRDVLGAQVFQKGSNITSERLRFDFSYERKMTDEEIKKTEEIINKRIKEDLKVDHMIVDLEKAKSMNAIGLFNEKYALKVSVYGVGPNFELKKNAKDTRVRGGYYSLEFCGGPHVGHTGIIGGIKITKEEAVSAGIRRIRAEIVLN